MVVDDEPMIRKLVAGALSMSGCSVLDPETPSEAMSLAEQHPELDLLVTDIVMPEIDGCELAERIRARLPDLKVLFISGFAPPGTKTSLGDGTDFLQKPFRMHQLTERVRQMLQ